MRLKSTIFTAALAALYAASAAGQVIDHKSPLRAATDTYARADDLPGQNRRFASQCRDVLGARSLCGCLGAKVPDGISFEQYVGVLARDKEANGYDQLPASARRLYDSLPSIRDACAVASEAGS